MRVRLINPDGYDNYRGTLLRLEEIGNMEFAFVKWDLPYHPCYPQLPSKHLALVEDEEDDLFAPSV